MGCGNSTVQPTPVANHTGNALKAALLIQMWYRRYLARLEARRRYTWSIFQSLEYEGEQDQLRLYNFFNEMMDHLNISEKGTNQPNNLLSILSTHTRTSPDDTEEGSSLYERTDPQKVSVPDSYRGPRLSFPLNTDQIHDLIRAFKKKQTLHAHYVLLLLHEMRKALKKAPTVIHISMRQTGQVTVCGDLHGKLDDLLIIFYKNGLPEPSNPYIFNGDFVDRGPHSAEVAILLFACFLSSPSSVYINRGNHEDHVMNLRYGFIKEIMTKYRGEASKLLRLFEDVFSWLPLATVVDNTVLVCHGGISDSTDLEYLSKIDRHKYLSALRPPVGRDTDRDSDDDGDDEDDIDLDEWRQVLDILWSDPRSAPGCHPNTFRGGGCYFGPDVTDQVLKKNGLKLLIRSHECKADGYEFDHGGKVLTIFSASNYYEVGSNKGAYVKLSPDMEPRVVPYMATKQAGRKLTFKARINRVENSALRALREKIYSSKTTLLTEFQKYDPTQTGNIKIGEWCEAMCDVFNMDLPWRSLRPKLVTSPEDGLVSYNSTFEEFKLENKKYNEDESSSVTEALYRNKQSLETIFRAIDKDNSGYISMDEFEEACTILNKHSHATVSKEHVMNMARNMDMNKDGLIDFNEFLEAFRIVDQFGRDVNRRRSQDSAQGSISPGKLVTSPPWSPAKLT